MNKVSWVNLEKYIYYEVYSLYRQCKELLIVNGEHCTENK